MPKKTRNTSEATKTRETTPRKSLLKLPPSIRSHSPANPKESEPRSFRSSIELNKEKQKYFNVPFLAIGGNRVLLAFNTSLLFLE